MRSDGVAASIDTRLSAERNLDRGIERAGKRKAEASRAEAHADRFESRLDRGEAAGKAAAAPRRSVRADLSSLARSVRFSLRAVLREVGRELDKQELAEVEQEVKSLYKAFRTELRDAFRGAREGGDREAFLQAVEGALDRLGEGLAQVIGPAENPETPAVPDEPLTSDVETGGAQQLQRSAEAAPDTAPTDSSGRFGSLLKALELRFEALYEQFRDRILPGRAGGSGDAPSFSRADGSVESAIRAYEDQRTD